MAKGLFLHPLPLAILLLIGLNAQSCTARNILFSGESLNEGENLQADEYILIMGHDCNLIMYEYNRAFWSTGTGGKGQGCRAMLKGNGMLVIYDKNSTVIWTSGKKGPKGSYAFVLKTESALTRNVEIYGPRIWSG